jgi:hypothetical protein
MGETIMITQEPTIKADQILTLTERRAFIKLPLDERRRQLAKQAERMVEHYESELEMTERVMWQGGDIVEF